MCIDYLQFFLIITFYNLQLKLGGIEHDYPFYYRCPFTTLDNGWDAFNMEQQFSKLILRCANKWRLSEVNKNFEVGFKNYFLSYLLGMFYISRNSDCSSRYWR